MKSDKKTNSTQPILSLLFHTIGLFLLLSLSSCGWVHKLVNKSQTQTTTQQQIITDSTSLKKKDSSGVIAEDSSHLKKQATVNKTGIEIHFTDSSNTNTVEIITDVQGKQIIQAKGHIRSVTTQQAHLALNLDSSHYQKQNQTTLQMLDSTKAVTQNQASLHQNTKTVSKEKKLTRLPWYSYTLLLVFILLFLYLRFRNKIKEFLKL